MKKILGCISVLAFFAISSCNKADVMQEAVTQTLKLKTKPVSVDVIKEIATKLAKRGLPPKGMGENQNMKTLSGEQKTILSQGKTYISDGEVIEIVSPLIYNGRQLQAELLSYVSSSSEWNELSETEKSEILYMSDEQAADLSLTYAAAVQTNSTTTAIIKDCISFALGVNGLKNVLTDLAAGPTISGAIGLLKFIGKRYLSWISIAWMVWDFADCVSHF